MKTKEELVQMLDFEVKGNPDPTALVYDLDCLVSVGGSPFAPDVTRVLALHKKCSSDERRFLFALYTLYKAWPQVRKHLIDKGEEEPTLE